MSAKQYTIDAYVLDSLMRDLVGHDHRASAYLVYLTLTAASEERLPSISHAKLAERTGLSKRSVQDAILHLVDRKLLRVTRHGATEVPRYETLAPWRHSSSADAESVD